MTGCERVIVIRARRISCQWSGVSNSFSFSKYCLEYLFVDKAFTKDSLQAPLHGFHKSFPDSGHVRCTWRVEHPLTASPLQLSFHFLFVNLFNSLFNFPISPNEVRSIVGAKLLHMSFSIEKSRQNQDKSPVSRDLATSRWTTREFIHTRWLPITSLQPFPFLSSRKKGQNSQLLNT